MARRKGRKGGHQTYDPSETNPLLSEVDSTPFSTEAAVASSSGIKSLVKSARAPAKYPDKGRKHFKRINLLATRLIVGKVIDPPKLKISSAGGRPCEAIMKEKSCDWKYSSNSFVEGKTLERWALVNLSSKVSNRDFIFDLQCSSICRGMYMMQPEFIIRRVRGNYNMDVFSSVEKMRQLLPFVGKYCKGVEIIIFIMTTKLKHDSYGYLKWVLETQFGLLSQCCLEESYVRFRRKQNTKVLDHLCMKINMKIGGRNVELLKPLPHGLVVEHVMMFIGACVNHPEPEDKTSPSIAAVVGTVNWPGANRYVARIETQKHRSEGIVNFGAICKDLVNTFSKFNKVKPEKILVFLGYEGELDTVVNGELRDLEEAISTFDFKSRVTFVGVQRRHETRIFHDVGSGEVDKALPGTVVDSATVHQSTDLDFYLCSHYTKERPNNGSKPIRYRVLRDENSFTSHHLQKLIYDLCFTDGRGTKPLRFVSPLYYAKLAAKRGRSYHRAANLCKKESDAATSSSSSSGNPSVEDEDCCRVHPNLANEMFFI